MARTDELNIPLPGMPSPAASYRVPRRKSGLEGNTKRMAIVAGGLAAGLAVLMGVWSLSTPRRGGVPVVQADSRPLREKPVNAGGMEVDGKDATILSGNADAAATLAPPPEAPDVSALKQQAAAAQAAAAAAQEAATKPATAPTVQAQTVAARPAVAPPPPVAVAAAPAPKPATAPKQAVQAAPPAGKAQVQLAALTSEEAAKNEWQRLEKRMPDLLGGRKPAVQKTEHDGKTYWRLRTGGFADAGEAAQFCERVRGKGGSCSVASF